MGGPWGLICQGIRKESVLDKLGMSDEHSCLPVLKQKQDTVSIFVNTRAAKIVKSKLRASSIVQSYYMYENIWFDANT